MATLDSKPTPPICGYFKQFDMSNHKWNGPERIICAAIWFDDGETWFDRECYRNIETGIVVCADGHHNCVAILDLILSKKAVIKKYGSPIPKYMYNYGFITSHRRYVDREDGYKIAKSQNQIIRPDAFQDILYSEDIMD